MEQEFKTRMQGLQKGKLLCSCFSLCYKVSFFPKVVFIPKANFFIKAHCSVKPLCESGAIEIVVALVR